MSDFKPVLVHSDYFSDGMTDEEFVEYILSAKKKNKDVPLSELIDVEKFKQSFDHEKALEKLKEFIVKHHAEIQEEELLQLLEVFYQSSKEKNVKI